MFKDFQTHTALERADQLVPMCGINSITPPKNGLDVLSGYESYSSCVFGLKVLQRKSSWSILNTKVALFLILSLIVDAWAAPVASLLSVHTHTHTHHMIAGAPYVAALNSCSVNLLDSTTLTTHRLEPGILQHGSLPPLRLPLPAGRGLISLCLFSSFLYNCPLCFRAHPTVFLLQFCLSLWPFSQTMTFLPCHCWLRVKV